MAEQGNGFTPMLGKQNYVLMIGSAVLILIGFLMMIGGGSDDPNVFNAEELYSFRRITLAPITVISGFVVAIFAIFWKGRNDTTSEKTPETPETSSDTDPS